MIQSFTRDIFRSFLFLMALAVGSSAVANQQPDPSLNADGTWLVMLAEDADPLDVAERLGAEYIGPLRGVDQYHRFRYTQQLQSRPDQEAARAAIGRQLASRPDVLAFEEDILVERFPRDFDPSDPLFNDQWHLENAGQSGGIPFSDAGVRPVWDAGFSGDGTVIGIVDEGTEFRHPDLLPNWLSGSGYDYNDEDTDPSPSDSEDRHGTAVAGISLSASNSVGGLGIAYNAQLVPLRLIAGPYRVGQEAEALSYRRQEVDIYNNSWGPSDDFGVRYADSSQALKNALAANVREGRGGLGNIYVWAAGNGGLNGDNSNYDGYNSLPYTISVGALGHDDIKAGYSEPGANLLVVAPSGGRGSGILTTDNTGFSGYASGDYYTNFSGTSAAAPMVSGVVALLLEQRPDLDWRDVQKILALSAVPVDFSDEIWTRNAAGHYVSHEYGYGRVNAEAASRIAANWPLMGSQQRILQLGLGPLPQSIPPAGTGTLVQTVSVSRDIRVQHAVLSVNISHGDWGDLRIELESPSGTVSVLAESHANANSAGQPGSWSYLSTHFLDESSLGTWTLRITDETSGSNGNLTNWNLEILGTDPAGSTNTPPEFEDLLIESAVYPLEVDVLEGIVDADGDPIEIISTQMPRVSKLIPLGDGRFSFSMGETIDGTDLFSVLVSDGNGSVRRRLIHVLDPRPVGRNDLYPVTAGFSGMLPVLSNDLDPDGDALRLTGIAGIFSGEASLEGGQGITYTAPPGYSGVERIQYFLTDDSDGESNGWVTVIVQEDPEVAVEFDGEDDFLRASQAPSVRTSDNFTAEAWIYPTSYGEYVTGFGRIMDRDSFVFFLNGFDHSFYNDQSLVAYFVLDNGQGVAANSNGGTIRLNTWQHVAISYDSSNAFTPVRMYVDGTPVGFSYPLDGTSAPRRPMQNSSSSPLYMGEAPSGARAFAGRMSEFRIWDGVRSETFIGQNYFKRMSGTESGLSFYLPLDRSLDLFAVNAGFAGGSAEVSGARRVPLELPWEPLEAHYNLLQDSGTGWWEDRTLGWLYGDLFPWVYLPSLNWAYTGHMEGEDFYYLWPLAENWGWVATGPGLYPWFQRLASDDWILYLEGSQNPSWFYSSVLEDWLPGDAAFPAN